MSWHPVAHVRARGVANQRQRTLYDDREAAWHGERLEPWQRAVAEAGSIIDHLLAVAELIATRLEAWVREMIETRSAAAARASSAVGTQWKVIPSSDGSMTRLAGERTTVMLSPEQVEKRRAAKRLARADPEAYLNACREGKL